MTFFREIKDLIRYKRTSVKDKLVMVYSEHSGYTVNFMPTLETLIKSYGLKICYVTSDPKDPILNTKNKNILPFYINKLLSFFMGMVDSPVCLMTMPDLNTYHIKRSAHPVNYVYIFHALMSTHMVYRFRAFDNFDTILCTGAYQVEEIRKTEEFYKLPPKKLIEAGYTRVEQVHSQYHEYLKIAPCKKKPCVLLAPGWASNNILESGGVDIIKSLLAEDYDVILRYHPETVRQRADILEIFDKAFINNPNVTIEKSVATNDSFMVADILITDWSGVSFEYAFGTERPVIYINTPRKVMNDRYEELEIEPFEVYVRNKIGESLDIIEIEKLAAVVKDIMANKERYVSEIVRLRNENIYNFLNAAHENAKAIIQTLKDSTTQR